MARQYKSKPTAPVEFFLDDVSFAAATGVSLLDLCELARYADLETLSPQGAVAVADFFRNLLGGDYDRFRQHCQTHRTDPDTLLKILSDIVEEVTEGRPTRRPPASAGGPPSTGPTLRVISSAGISEPEILTPQREAEIRAAIARQESAAG